jgi:hypothetical protein
MCIYMLVVCMQAMTVGFDVVTTLTMNSSVLWNITVRYLIFVVPGSGKFHPSIVGCSTVRLSTD